MHERKRLPLKQKMEFSKKILIAVSIATLLVVVTSLVLMWITRDLSALSYIITGIFAELASATGFYYWKAKAENMIKLRKEEGVEITGDLQIRDLDKEAVG